MLAKVKLGKWKGVGALALFLAVLVAAPVKADLQSYTDSNAAQDAGLVELFTVTISGVASTPGVGGVPDGVTITFTNNGVTENTKTGSFTLGTGTEVVGRYTGWSFTFNLGDLFEGYEDFSLLGFAIISDSHSGNDLRNIAVNAGGGTFETWTATSTSKLFGVTTSTTNYNSAFSFTVTYYGTVTEFPPTEAPEPATLALMGLGLAGVGLARRRMRK